MYYHYPMMNDYGLGGGIMMLLVWLAILVLLVAAITYVIRTAGPGKNERTSALDIAKERYAKGEITKQEYEQLKKDLK
jgi:putative membrane protein